MVARIVVAVGSSNDPAATFRLYFWRRVHLEFQLQCAVGHGLQRFYLLIAQRVGQLGCPSAVGDVVGSRTGGRRFDGRRCICGSRLSGDHTYHHTHGTDEGGQVLHVPHRFIGYSSHEYHLSR